MTIGIDIDDVIADFIPALLLFHNDRYGTNLTYEEFHNNEGWYKIWGGTEDDDIRKVYEFYETDHFYGLPVVSDANEILRKLKINHKLILITAREETIAQPTLNWIEKHFPEIFDSVHFTNSYSQNLVQKKKSDICKEKSVDIMVDDSIKNTLDCSSNGINVLLVDRPWNRNFIPPENVKRVFSWGDIHDVINTFSKMRTL
jgi:uncharacterized HAD superfamily protein